MTLLDFYRGTLSARELGVLIGQLSSTSGFVRARYGGEPPLTLTESLLADVWAQLEAIRVPKKKNQDHPVRVERQAAARAKAKQAKVLKFRDKLEKHKQTYGLG